MDEVGKGSLAGAIVAVAAVFNCKDPPIDGIKDSKKFSSRAKRHEVFRALLNCPELVAFSVSSVSAAEIDRHGIGRANARIFHEAVHELRVQPDFVYVDGNWPIEGWPSDRQKNEPKADVNYWQVSAASILAKEIRDLEMRELAPLFPDYDFSSNMGYGSPVHIEALQRFGITPHHRKIFTRKFHTSPKAPHAPMLRVQQDSPNETRAGLFPVQALLHLPHREVLGHSDDRSRKGNTTRSKSVEINFALPKIFVALDVETSNQRRANICELGLVRVENGVITKRVNHLVRPRDPFFTTTWVHGIAWHHVKDADLFSDIWPRVQDLFAGAEAIVAHGIGCDRNAIQDACAEAGLPVPALPWECTLKLGRKRWGLRYNRLPDLCAYLNIPFEGCHHQALEDAEACAKIRIACAAT